MKMPGFTAETSLYKMNNHYCSIGIYSAFDSSKGVLPQQFEWETGILDSWQDYACRVRWGSCSGDCKQFLSACLRSGATPRSDCYADFQECKTECYDRYLSC